MTYTAFEEFRKRKIVDNSILTASEIQYRREATAEIAVGTSTEYVHSVKFPMSTSAVAQLRGLTSGSVNFVQLVCTPTPLFLLIPLLLVLVLVLVLVLLVLLFPLPPSSFRVVFNTVCLLVFPS
jgi:hypothetical protein